LIRGGIAMLVVYMNIWAHMDSYGLIWVAINDEKECCMNADSSLDDGVGSVHLLPLRS